MRIDPIEHQKQPWRSHELMKDFEVEDVWTLPVCLRDDQDIDQVQELFSAAIKETSLKGLAGLLFKLRNLLGKVFDWDSHDQELCTSIAQGSIRERYAGQESLTVDQLPTKGFADFIPVYNLKNEALLEIDNETVQAAIHLGRVLKNNDYYNIQMCVYVKPKGLLGRTYMSLIKPFRLYIVYPKLLKMIHQQWIKSQKHLLDAVIL